MGRKVLNGSHSDLIEKRRELVAEMRLKGFSLRRITESLAAGYVDKSTGVVLGRIVNPDTNEPFALKTIQDDLDVMKAQWRKNSEVSIEEQIAREEAKIDELERIAWAKGKYELIPRCWERRAKLKGLDKPEKRDITSDGQPLQPTINIYQVPARDAGEEKDKS